MSCRHKSKESAGSNKAQFQSGKESSYSFKEQVFDLVRAPIRRNFVNTGEHHRRSGPAFLLNLVRIDGSVFPSALRVAVPSALVAGLLHWFIERDYISMSGKGEPMQEAAAWSGFSSLVGFLIVFRTSQSYNRFWDGCTATNAMRAEWFDACASIIAFCRFSKVEAHIQDKFQHLLIRLFSLLHAVALAEIEDHESDSEGILAFGFELIDPEGIDMRSLQEVKISSQKPELVFQWIQSLIVDNMRTEVLSVPPPILSRAFHELANGMVAWHDAKKISHIPFPFPYAQTCDCVLVIHVMLAPIVTSSWVFAWYWAAVLTFIQVFVLWSLNYIAQEIECPFGEDSNDLDGRQMQSEMNESLLLLVSKSSQRVPRLSAKAVMDLEGWQSEGGRDVGGKTKHRHSLNDIWRVCEAEGLSAADSEPTSPVDLERGHHPGAERAPSAEVATQPETLLSRDAVHGNGGSQRAASSSDFQKMHLDIDDCAASPVPDALPDVRMPEQFSSNPGLRAQVDDSPTTKLDQKLLMVQLPQTQRQELCEARKAKAKDPVECDVHLPSSYDRTIL